MGQWYNFCWKTVKSTYIDIGVSGCQAMSKQGCESALAYSPFAREDKDLVLHIGQTVFYYIYCRIGETGSTCELHFTLHKQL